MPRYAILKIGSHQYRVQENDVLAVERLDSGTGEPDKKEVRFEEVLLLGDNEKSQIGQPFVSGAFVVCEVIQEAKQPKTISFKFKRRKGYKKIKGHRQVLTQLKVKSISPEQV